MTADLATVWSRIRQHEGEGFQLIRGDVFTYEMFDNYLRPVGRVRHLSRTSFGKALARVPLDGYQSVKDLQGLSYVYAILMDPRIQRGDW